VKGSGRFSAAEDAHCKLALRLHFVADCLGVVSQALILVRADHSLGPFTPSDTLAFTEKGNNVRNMLNIQTSRKQEISLSHISSTIDGPQM